jgi:hypothetical protein
VFLFIGALLDWPHRAMTAGSGKGRLNDRRPDITTELFL